jgi:N6-adenosine-specific RNA methylase IME4
MASVTTPALEVKAVTPTAEKEILLAWRQYQRVEKYGLAFGKVCYRWQQKLAERGQRVKGRGVVPILEQLDIPISTAYWWIARYKESGVIKDKPRQKQTAGPLPQGTYRVVLADPPWPYNIPLPKNYGAADHHFPTMPLDDISNLKLPTVADNAVLFLWVPAPHLENAFKVISAWGFRYATNIVWDKVKHNWGHYVSVRHEHLLVAVRGTCLPSGQHIDQGGVERIELIDSVQSIERTEHSRKPQKFREIIDKMYSTGPRIELFARGELPAHWDGWGDEFQRPYAVAAD